MTISGLKWHDWKKGDAWNLMSSHLFINSWLNWMMNQSLTAWKWLFNPPFPSISNRWALGIPRYCFANACLFVSYRWISLSMKFSSLRINQEKMMCFQELGLSRLARGTSLPPIFSGAILTFHFQGLLYTCLVCSPPFPPHFLHYGKTSRTRRHQSLAW